MSFEQALRDLDKAIIDLEPANRAAAIVALAARLAAVAAPILAAPASDWLTAEDAADLARVPTSRVKAWARRTGATWATRPTRKTLRVDRAAFLAWLRRDPSLSLRIDANQRNGRPSGAEMAPIRALSSGRSR